MGLENFKLSTVNPNDDIGGGGCLCRPDRKATDCKPPYIVFPETETSENASPHAVLCTACAHKAAALVTQAPGTQLHSGTPEDAPEDPETGDWNDLTKDEQANARKVAKPGELVGIADVRVRVPLEQQRRALVPVVVPAPEQPLPKPATIGADGPEV